MRRSVGGDRLCMVLRREQINEISGLVRHLTATVTAKAEQYADTIMPGYAINDFGDSIRFGATTAAEDEADLSKVNFDISLFELYVKGFIEGAKGGLTDTEIGFLPESAIMMTLECGMRFLTDYLSGDTYFKISRPTQNLDRARNQFKLVADMESRLDEMHGIVDKYAK